ncbi:DNA-3-methyladenine glycosylase II [Pseudoduganella flava]|uniref:DNA-3-methyladenine glycosylase II n=1 Tax=Pseudoduganella flava TaxID=871742 RepID=A0A562PJ54_9BURK|nr:Ada metal-binding domain-containing protein [Pseudoduganella flava]QGZ41996.1 helix-turn-helix domain-containing protein [Pseudoduganella flava]TWI44408.1 DNA-3-methyladenine glycosylase II [Pseudoduganella flava]
MDLNDRISCYRALQTRDTRFDGRLFVGVTSTGIYCRPICPARTARIENCRFFASAAAAQQEGFRPCLRCRPESAPGGGAWRGSSDTVARALALFAETGHDERAVEAVAARLQVSARQLRRLFQQHLGAAPVTVLQTRRILLAKQLIHETRLPMTDVAMAAGFGSVRRFNETFKAMYRRAPSALRHGAGNAASGEELVLRLRYQPPYDWSAMLSACVPLPGVAVTGQGQYARTLRIGAVPGTLRVAHDPHRHGLTVGLRLADVRAMPEALERVTRVFDTAADIATINAHLSTDPLLAPLVARRPGLRPLGSWDGFEAAVLALLPAAGVAALLDLCADPLPATLCLPGLERLFPTAAAVAAAHLATLPVTAAQHGALRTLAEAAAADPTLFDAVADVTFDHSAFNHPALAERSAGWQPWLAYAARHLDSLNHNEETS